MPKHKRRSLAWRVYSHSEIAARHPALFLRMYFSHPGSPFARTVESRGAALIAGFTLGLSGTERLRQECEG